MNDLAKKSSAAARATAKAARTGLQGDHQAAVTAHNEARIAFWTALSDATPADRTRIRSKAEEHSRKMTEHEQAIKAILSAHYANKKEAWSTRDVLARGRPPVTVNVLDQHGNFTIETESGDSLTRVGDRLKLGTTGALIDFNGDSFYQNYDNVTEARYKVKGLARPALVWFDNRTGKRIA